MCKKIKGVIWLVSLCFLLSSCDESLPTRIVPQNILGIENVIINQGTGPAGIHVSIAVGVQNVYEETFYDVVDITGNIHIWQKQNPSIEANLPISQHAKLQLKPGEKHFIYNFWLLETDDGQDIIELLDFSGNDARFGILYARPELFILEVKVTFFKETGLLTSGPHEFTLQGWKPVPQVKQP